MIQYRLMTVKRVRDCKTHIQVDFEDSIVTISMDKKCLQERFGEKFDVESITEGQQLFILGRSGNEDVCLARPDCIEDMRLA